MNKEINQLFIPPMDLDEARRVLGPRIGHIKRVRRENPCGALSLMKKELQEIEEYSGSDSQLARAYETIIAVWDYEHD